MKNSKHAVRKVAQAAFLIWKELGETPLQALERLRMQEGIESEVKMTYAGRLDPLAEGELLILVGEECKKKDEYLGLDKEYKVEILLGAQTDTGDVMGVVSEMTNSPDNYPQALLSLQRREQQSSDLGQLKELSTKPKSCGGPSDNVRTICLESILYSFTGKVSWVYPAFSSKTVQGKPLFLWALEGKMDEIEIPMRESEIYELELLGGKTISLSELREQIHAKINSIKTVPESVESKRLGADFRREEVLKSWADSFEKSTVGREQGFEIITIRCKCSSGTYMRTLAQKIGEELGTQALALSIVRTKIMVE